MRLPILCYHKVGPIDEEGRFLNVEPSHLKAQAAFFHRRGYRFVRARELAGEWQHRSVCFTFDDAYESAVSQAVPILSDIGATATFYAVSNKVGGTSDWDGELARPLAGWDLLRWAMEHSFEIGNHTANHVRLDKVDEATARREVAQGLASLSQHGFGLASFCYPYGMHVEASRAAVAAAGHPIAVSLGKRAATPNDDRLALPRITISYGDRLAGLLYKLHIRPKLP